METKVWIIFVDFFSFALQFFSNFPNDLANKFQCFWIFLWRLFFFQILSFFYILKISYCQISYHSRCITDSNFCFNSRHDNFFFVSLIFSFLSIFAVHRLKISIGICGYSLTFSIRFKQIPIKQIQRHLNCLKKHWIKLAI